MDTKISLIISGVVVLVSWGMSVFIYKRHEDKLKGKTWLVGVIGFLLLFGFYWIIGYYLTFELLLPIGALTLPWWLNYMYYLNKSKRVKERMVLND